MSGFESVISVLATFILFGMTIIFWILWYRKRQQVREYQPLGFVMGAVMIVLEILMLLFLFNNSHQLSILSLIIADFFVFLRISAYTIIGIYYCAQLGIPSFPFLIYSGRFGIDISRNTQIEEQEVSNAHILVEEGAKDVEVVTETERDSLYYVPPTSIHKMLFSSLTVAAGGILFSVLLFLAFKPTLSSLAQERFNQELTIESLPFSMLLVLSFAFAEEIIFRLGIQNLFAKHFGWQGKRYWWAIILTTIIWTMGHVGVLDPNWVKMVQVFPVGLALGWLFRKYGTESAIIAHSVFNVVLLFASEMLIS